MDAQILTEKSTGLVGTWRLIRGEYTLPNGQPDPEMRVKNAIRIYNNENIAVFYEMEDGTTATRIAEYEWDGEDITIHVMHHAKIQETGLQFYGKVKVDGNRMQHRVNMSDGYKINEEYERVEHKFKRAEYL
jgi:hypothetical protein